MFRSPLIMAVPTACSDDKYRPRYPDGVWAPPGAQLAGNAAAIATAIANLSTASSGSVRSYVSTPVAGYGGVIMLDRSIAWADAGDTATVWIGRWLGNSGGITITWDIADGSVATTTAVTGYAGLIKIVTFDDGEYGWKSIDIPLAARALPDRQHIVLRVTSVEISNAAPFYSAATNQCYVRIDNGTVVNPDRLWCNKDHSSASDSNAGTQSAPFLTLQRLADQMVSQNKSGYVVAASTPYQELRKISGAPHGGMTIYRPTGGENYNDFIYLDGLASNGARISTAFTGTPIIDNQWITSSGSWGDCPLFIYNADSIWVCDFEMRNCANGFMTDPGGSGCSKIIAERIDSHHMIGGDNIASFRWDNSDYCVIHNCRAHHNYDNRPTSAQNPYGDSIITAGNYSGQTVYGPHNGIQAFGGNQMIVEYSDIHDVSRPVYGKEQRGPDQPSGYSFALDQSIWVRNSYIHKATSSAYDPHNQGARPGAKNIGFMFNAVLDADHFVYAADGGASGGQATGAYIFNNSGYHVEGPYDIRGMTGVRAGDNILHTPNPLIGNSTPKVIDLLNAENGVDATRVESSKGNTYYNYPALEFNIGSHQETTLAGFASVYTDHTASVSAYLTENPEASYSTADPNFVSPSTGNFARTGTPTDSFLGPSARGAKVDPQTVVGNY